MKSRAAAFAGFFLAAALLLVGLAPLASADVPITVYGLLPSSAQAGGHPDLQAGFSLKNSAQQLLEDGTNTPCDCQNARFITVHAPSGLVGSPQSVPRCTAAQFAATNCSVDSQVGVIEVGVSITGTLDISFVEPIYNLVPLEGQSGLLAFQVLGVNIFEVVSARTGSDYGLDTRIVIPNGTPLGYSDQILWGVPADPSHDRLRYPRGRASIEGIFSKLCGLDRVRATPSEEDLKTPPRGPASAAMTCLDDPTLPEGLDGIPSNSPSVPFLQSPTACGVELKSSIDVLSFDGGETHSSSPFPTTSGCDQLSFNPSLAARPSSASADSPSGIDVDLTVPQFQSATVPSPSEIRGTEMLLPEGFTINPNAADGKTACSDAEARFGSEDQAQCPETSKIGTLEIETTLLPGPLPGFLYLGKPLPGNRYRIFLVADGFAVHVKLAGTIRPDPKTGRVAVVFEDLPQTPFQKFSLHIFGSERGALATPTKCGTYGITTTFTPWDTVLGKQSSQTFFTIDSGPNGSPCPGATRPFAPNFEAASAGNAAGAHSPFAVNLTRPDGNQFLSGLSVSTPLGFSATLKGVPYCPEAAIVRLESSSYSGLSEFASPACPAASQIGTVSAGAGAGSRPFYATGKAYLAGPYKGAPLSLVVVVPAVSGPYDLGNVVVRAAIEVNPITAQVTTVSDPLPQIIEGIPLRTRQIQVNIDRPDFALNPTNCRPQAASAKVSGSEGAVVERQARYQVANCATLPFAPKLTLNLHGGTKRAGHPRLHAVLQARAGDANISSAVVALPHSEFLDQSHIGTICTRVQFAADNCPAASIYGRATAVTPILGEPLSGPVYLRSSSHKLPDLVAALHGQVDFDIAGRIDSVNGGIRSTFEGLPDVPVTKFVLDMRGGSKGLLVNSRNICKRPGIASVRLGGQNGKSSKAGVPLRAACGARGGRGKRNQRAAKGER